MGDNRDYIKKQAGIFMDRLKVRDKLAQFSFTKQSDVALFLMGNFEAEILEILRHEYKTGTLAVIMSYGIGMMTPDLTGWEKMGDGQPVEVLRKHRNADFHNGEYRLHLEAMYALVAEMATITWPSMMIERVKRNLRSQIQAS